MIKLIDYDRNKNGEVIFLDKSTISGMVRDNENNVTRIWDNCINHIVKETPEEILAMPDIETAEKVIDWEQRRYEIAKEIIGHIYEIIFNVDYYVPRELIVEDAIKYADTLIKELKKGGEK